AMLPPRSAPDCPHSSLDRLPPENPYRRSSRQCMPSHRCAQRSTVATAQRTRLLLLHSRRFRGMWSKRESHPWGLASLPDSLVLPPTSCDTRRRSLGYSHLL